MGLGLELYGTCRGLFGVFLKMVMNFEVLYETHNFFTRRMIVLYAFRVLLVVKAITSSGHTHETPCVWTSRS
jgi:hypothetical protein